MDEYIIIDLHSRGKIKAFIVKMLYNTIKWERTRFKNELGYETPTEFFADVPQEVVEHPDLNLDKLYWYDHDMLHLYAEIRNYKKISNMTGIPTTSIFNTIKKTKKQIKKQL